MSEHGAALQTYNQELVKCMYSTSVTLNKVLTSTCI